MSRPRLALVAPDGRLVTRSTRLVVVALQPGVVPVVPWRRTQARPVVRGVLQLQDKPQRWQLLLACGHTELRPARRVRGELQLCRPTARCATCADGPGGSKHPTG